MSAPVAGVGLGLRWEFLDDFMARCPEGLDFVEVSPENYMRRGGYFPAALAFVASKYPVVTHGLTMSLGGSDPLDATYLAELAAFVAEIASPWHSDHLSFGAASGRVLHELLPIAFRREAIQRVADRVRRAEDALRVPVAIENVTYYLEPGASDLREPEFLAEVCARAGCGLLLDVNNVFVNAQNFGFDPAAWMRAAPLERVVQIHVAGHEHFDEATLARTTARGEGTIILDTHGAPVVPAVGALLEQALGRTGKVPVLLERDTNIPPLDALLAEVAALRVVWERATSAPA